VPVKTASWGRENMVTTEKFLLIGAKSLPQGTAGSELLVEFEAMDSFTRYLRILEAFLYVLE
jgi:hypothetical protein